VVTQSQPARGSLAQNKYNANRRPFAHAASCPTKNLIFVTGAVRERDQSWSLDRVVPQTTQNKLDSSGHNAPGLQQQPRLPRNQTAETHYNRNPILEHPRVCTNTRRHPDGFRRRRALAAAAAATQQAHICTDRGREEQSTKGGEGEVAPYRQIHEAPNTSTTAAARKRKAKRAVFRARP
ncbi:unnamed protein product, partial [Ectocarpus sp. 6 AP-2014]